MIEFTDSRDWILVDKNSDNNHFLKLKYNIYIDYGIKSSQDKINFNKLLEKENIGLIVFTCKQDLDSLKLDNPHVKTLYLTTGSLTRYFDNIYQNYIFYLESGKNILIFGNQRNSIWFLAIQTLLLNIQLMNYQQPCITRDFKYLMACNLDIDKLVSEKLNYNYLVKYLDSKLQGFYGF